MIDTVKKIRSAIAACAAGKTPTEFEKERLQQGVTDAVSRWLADHPDYYAAYESGADSTPMSASAPITDSGMKKRCIKALGAARLVKANGEPVVVDHTEDSIDPDALALAIAKCRDLKAADPDRYNQDIRYA